MQNQDIMVDPAVIERLRDYRALDHPIRLHAVEFIRKRPGVSFNDLAKDLHVESGLLAFHVGVLKAADLVDVEYGRREGKSLSAYALSPRGEKAYSNLLAAVKDAMNRTEKPTLRPSAPEPRRKPGLVPRAASGSVHVRAYVTARKSRKRTARKA